MNGNSRILLDTNAVISLLSGNQSLNVVLTEAAWVGISIITKLEFLSFPDILPHDVELFSAFEKRVVVVDIVASNEMLITTTVNLRKRYRLKMPDAIILASATNNDAVLLTEDQKLLTKCPEICNPLP